MNNKNDLTILSGSDLSNISNKKDREDGIKKIRKTNWLQFDYFIEERDEGINKVITYFENVNGNNDIKACLYK